MTQDMLNKIKELAEENWCLDENDPNLIIADDEEFAVTNPWIDHSGRFPLNDMEAVKEWGLATMVDFIEKAQKKIMEV